MARKFVFTISVLLILGTFFVNCSGGSQSSGPDAPNQGSGGSETTCYEHFAQNDEWRSETEVVIDGYSANSMEPKIAADQGVLFFNDKPATGDSDMNIHYAVRQSNGRYQYIGTLPGTVAAGALDGVPAIDTSARFYFVSTRTYSSNFQMIYGGLAQVVGPNALSISNIASADAAVTTAKAGTVDMDIDVSWDGSQMIVSRAQFSGNPYPDSSQLVLFDINTSTRQAIPKADGATLLAKVNSEKCVIYAGNLSSDMKELYFSFFPKGSTDLDGFRVAVSKRDSTSTPFGKPEIIRGIMGQLTEGPSITFNDGGKTLYYHKFDSASGRFKIYKVTRP